MNREIPKFKILGKIDLDSQKTPKERKVLREKKDLEKIKKRNKNEIISDIETAMIHNISLIKERFSSYEGVSKNIINNNAQINMDAFNPPYSDAMIKNDKHLTNEQKKAFYYTYEPAIQEKYNETDQNKLVKIIAAAESEKMRDGVISEDLLLIVMNKISGDRYITVKASDYDDFNNGVDMLLIDTETHNIICTFDATVSDVNTRMNHKMSRAKKKLDHGKGLHTKYSISFTKNNDGISEIKLGQNDNIPPLFLDLNKNDLMKMMLIMDFKIDSPLSNVEICAIHNLLDKLDNQIIELQERAGKNLSYKSSLDFINHVRENLKDISIKKPE